ncbi:MAG: rhomboid family intramembrane serine protease [Verrucomicrobiales bacterium]|jgi:membrane associated rhomboid family serine protease|nr:rhomboid family intramembrane serine protease [Verrucomicrobiales bacterium]
MPHRNWSPDSRSTAPLTHVRGVPVDLTTILVASQVLAMVATAVVLSWFPAVLRSWQSWTCFFPAHYLAAGHYWTLLTYPFYHDIRSEHIFFAIEMLMFFWFGREVERSLGRRAYAALYGLLIVVQPLTMLALRGLAAAALAGSGMLLFGMGVAFAVIYPTARLFGLIAAKWVVWIFLLVFSVYFLAQREWPGLARFWVVAAAAAGLTRAAGAGADAGWLDWLEQARRERAERRRRDRAAAQRQRARREEASVDSVLEKISREGLAALAPDEREVLQRARQKLLRQDRRR